MGNEGHPSYCAQCGSIAQSGDRFCGICGAPALPPPEQAEQVIPRDAAASRDAAYAGERRTLAWVVGLGAVAVLLTGGALAAAELMGALGPTSDATDTASDGAPDGEGGGVVSSPPGDASPENMEPSDETTMLADDPAPSDGTPHPAFNPLLTTLAGMTSAPVALPSDLPPQFQDVAIDEATEGDDYALLFLDDQAESGEVVQPFVNAWVDGTLEAAPVVEGEPELPDPGSGFEFASGQAMTFGDGAVGAYNCYEPSSGTGGTGGPFCIGAYTRDEYRYLLTLEGPTPPKGEMGQMLSSMTSADEPSLESTSSVSPEPTTQEPTTFGLSPEGEDQVREAAEQYYYAVDYESWDTTYYNLDAKSKALFTEEEWIAKNRWYAEIEGLELDFMEIDVTMDGEERAEVTVDRTFTDGTSIMRDTVFVWEDYWRHHLTEEEKEIFMPGVPYEEFVDAQ